MAINSAMARTQEFAAPLQREPSRWSEATQQSAEVIIERRAGRSTSQEWICALAARKAIARQLKKKFPLARVCDYRGDAGIQKIFSGPSSI
jgi:hypothetical protein